MGQVMDDFNNAITLYIGWKINPFPKEDEGRVLDRFGLAAGGVLVTRVRAILDELQQLQPNWNEHDLVSASKWAADQIKLKNPELDDAAIAALEWIYSWWCK